MKKFGRYMLLSVVAICGTVLSAITKDMQYAQGAGGLVAFLGFFAFMTESD